MACWLLWMRWTVESWTGVFKCILDHPRAEWKSKMNKCPRIPTITSSSLSFWFTFIRSVPITKSRIFTTHTFTCCSHRSSLLSRLFFTLHNYFTLSIEWVRERKREKYEWMNILPIELLCVHPIQLLNKQKWKPNDSYMSLKLIKNEESKNKKPHEIRKTYNQTYVTTHNYISFGSYTDWIYIHTTHAHTYRTEQLYFCCILGWCWAQFLRNWFER